MFRDVSYGSFWISRLEDEVRHHIEQGHAILGARPIPSNQRSSRGLRPRLSSARATEPQRIYQSGWDTDQFPNNVPEVALAYYEILKAGGFTTGGTNFDARLRRQSLDPQDLVAAHVGGMDVCAAGLKAAAAMLEDGTLEAMRAERYAGWDSEEGKALLESATLEDCHARVIDSGIQPEPRSGRQERLENIVNRFV